MTCYTSEGLRCDEPVDALSDVIYGSSLLNFDSDNQSAVTVGEFRPQLISALASANSIDWSSVEEALNDPAFAPLLPDNLSDNAACYVEPLANAIHGVQRANIQFDDVVVVAGAGPIGMGMVQAAALKTPRKLILINSSKAKRDLALKLGADLAFAPDDLALQDTLNTLTNGRGCDVYLEASGQTSSFTMALDLVRKAGKIVVFGVYKDPVMVDLNVFGEFKELDILGGHLAPFTYATALDLLARGLIDGDACVTHTYELKDVHEAFKRTQGPDEVQIKVVFRP